jgi:peptidoglycan hydrolase-like protein with peptidoglycan-binding domain
MASQLAQLKASIQALINGTSVMPKTATIGATTSGTSSYKFTLPLSYGDSGPEVRELQKRLLTEGFFSSEISDYFGPATEQAVKAYQKTNGLSSLGNVGPGTRAALNK